MEGEWPKVRHIFPEGVICPTFGRSKYKTRENRIHCRLSAVDILSYCRRMGSWGRWRNPP
jgi:hypothetical protein